MLEYIFLVGSTIFSPLLVNELAIPYIYHPFRFNNIPFVEPTSIKYTMWFLIFNSIYIFIVSLISSLMSTLKNCKDINIFRTIIGTIYPVLFGIFSLIFIYMFPVFKTPLLAIFAPVPYSNYIVNGLFMSMFVMIGGLLSNNYSNYYACI